MPTGLNYTIYYSPSCPINKINTLKVKKYNVIITLAMRKPCREQQSKLRNEAIISRDPSNVVEVFSFTIPGCFNGIMFKIMDTKYNG